MTAREEMSRIDEVMLDQGWVTLRNAAEKMNVSLSTIYRLVARGDLKCHKAAGKRYVSIRSCLDHLGPVAAKALGLAPTVPPVGAAK